VISPAEGFGYAGLQFLLPGAKFACRKLHNSRGFLTNAVPLETTMRPQHLTRDLQFEHGTAVGVSVRWNQGQYCSILTPAGIVGCGIYDMKTPAEFGQAIAIARGTPAQPLVEPEDLLAAKIVDCTPKAKSFGIEIGMTGREAVELMLQAELS
jgi:uncharacterized protein YunC (DUF1805 family)